MRKGCSRTSPAQVKSQIFFSFWPSTIISCEGVAPGQVRHKKNRNFSSVFDHRPSFRAGQVRHKKNRNFSSVFYHRPSFRAKGLLRDKSGTRKIAIFPQFLAIDPHFVRKGCSGTSPAQEKSQFFRSFCWSTLFSCERVDVSWLAAGTTLGLKRER